jgi:predicted house-cleaning noncanonical NTP pyrophosphatase (MazG superfamily)
LAKETVIMKLVRDRIGDLPWPDEDSKRHLGWVEPHSSRYRQMLRDKLREEIAELLAVDGTGQPGAVLDETADVFEVLRALLVANGVDSPARSGDALRRAAAVKLAARGGFFQGRIYDGPVRVNKTEAEKP